MQWNNSINAGFTTGKPWTPYETPIQKLMLNNN